MVQSNGAKLEKLKILAYKDSARREKAGVFEVMFNPDSYSFSYTNQYDTSTPLAHQGSNARYTLSLSQQLHVKILLDGTGVNGYAANKPVDVPAKVKAFMELTAKVSEETGQPLSLILQWGDIFFRCKLASLDINYTLFNNSGVPLRAELDTRFIEDNGDEENRKENNRITADQTNSRIVVAGDQLPLLCEQIYGSQLYYMAVARANKLQDFRNLQPGQEIVFPPIEK